jgi:hypothetical protein
MVDFRLLIESPARASSQLSIIHPKSTIKNSSRPSSGYGRIGRPNEGEAERSPADTQARTIQPVTTRRQ